MEENFIDIVCSFVSVILYGMKIYMECNFDFMVSGRTVKSKSVNWCLQNTSLATINVVMGASIKL